MKEYNVREFDSIDNDETNDYRKGRRKNRFNNKWRDKQRWNKEKDKPRKVKYENAEEEDW